MKICDSILAEKYNEVLGYKMLVEKPFGFFDKIGAKIGSALGSQSSAAKLDAGNLLNRYYQSFKEYLIKGNLNTNTVTNQIFKNYFKKAFINVEKSPTWQSIPSGSDKKSNQPVADIEKTFKKIIGEWNLYKDDASNQTPEDSNQTTIQDPATPATPPDGSRSTARNQGGGSGARGGRTNSNRQPVINITLNNALNDVVSTLGGKANGASLLDRIKKLSAKQLQKLKADIETLEIAKDKIEKKPSMDTILARQGNVKQGK